MKFNYCLLGENDDVNLKKIENFAFQLKIFINLTSSSFFCVHSLPLEETLINFLLDKLH